MIKIVKIGKTKKWTIICPECGTEFTYNKEDIITQALTQTITCPVCKSILDHDANKDNYVEEDFNKQLETIDFTKLTTNPYVDSDKYYQSFFIQNKHCQTCSWYEQVLKNGNLYVGDTPCNWCPYGNTVTCNTNTSNSIKGE